MPGNAGGLSFAEKIKTIQVSTGRTRPRSRETRVDGAVERRVVEHTDSGAVIETRSHKERQDVHVHAPLLTPAGGGQ
jgi:hypothetical protein